MSKIKTLIKLISSYNGVLHAVFLNFQELKISRLINDELYLKFAYLCCVGKKLNIKNPTGFCAKLQWLKLHNRKPEYSILVDKYAVKDYVANIIGYKYIIPTLGAWNDIKDIDFDKLPEQFVLKWNHDSGSIIICRDKTHFDKQKALQKLQKGATKNGYWFGREWPYKNVKPIIIAEQFMRDNTSKETDLIDYKFYCFDGEPLYCQVIRDRSTNETIDFYDMNWNLMPFVGLNPVAKNGLNPVAKPICLTEMIDICRKLADKAPFIRIDLYLINNKIYFGEITLFPASGFGVFTPEEWDQKLGDLIKLPL